MKNSVIAVCSVVIYFLAACSAPLSATPPPTLQVVEGAFTPALRPLETALQDCAHAHPEIALFMDESPASSMDPGELAFRFGEPAGGMAFEAPIAWEEILVILNNNNPLTRLATPTLVDLFGGRISTWDELSGSNHPVQVWIYPDEDDARQVFDRVALGGKPAPAQALLAPDPAAMLEAVSTDPGAIGYLPRAWLEVEAGKGRVKTASLEAGLSAALRQPVLAVAAQTPEGGAHTLLVCLQGSAGRQALEKLYEPWEE